MSQSAAPSAAELLARFLERQGAGDVVGALPLIEQLAGLLPDNGRIQAFLAFTLERLERSDEALVAYDRAVALDPGYVDALHNRACLLARRQDPAAEAGFLAVLAAAPDHADARAALAALRGARLQPAFDRARALEQVGDRGGAEAAYRALLSELPDNVPVLQNLAGLIAPRNPQDATELWQRALGLEPDNLEVRATFGQFLFARGRLAAALPHLAAVVARRPDDPALAELIQAKADLCAWDDVQQLAPRVAAAIRAGSPLIPMAAVRFGGDDPGLVELAGRRFMRHVLERSFPHGVVARQHARPATRPERLRVGYLSSDLRGHIIGLLLAAVLERHDRTRFEVHAYTLGRRRDGVTERIRDAVAGFVDVAALTPVQIAERIAGDRIDLLIEMNGWTREGRSEALASRPAPVQLQWLGYPGTSGGDFIDYVIADTITVPPGTERWFTERILRLPYTHQPFDPALAQAATPTRDLLGLPNDALVLASLVPHWKITRPVFEVWLRVLGAVPDAVLWLVDGTTEARRQLEAAAAAHGIAPTRLVWARPVSMTEFLGQLSAADLFVDTFPYGGHSTASGALFAGLPIVSLVGRGFASRVAGSVLHAAGLGRLAADNLADYEALILELSRDRAALARLRADVAAARETAPLFDLDGFVHRLEAGYEAAWQLWYRGKPTRDITVPSV
jgi:predicted O-linked N-acetylglucosamine transferase (SPINDLY family)